MSSTTNDVGNDAHETYSWVFMVYGVECCQKQVNRSKRIGMRSNIGENLSQFFASNFSESLRTFASFRHLNKYGYNSERNCVVIEHIAEKRP